MARSTIAFALLGLLACAAIAQAEDVETQTRHHGGHDGKHHDDGGYNGKHHDDGGHDGGHDDNKRVFSLKVANPVFTYAPAGTPVVGSTAVLTFNLVNKDNEVIGTGRLTGIATDLALPAFTLNADLSIVITQGRYKGTILTASGPVQWDGKNIAKPLNTMVVTGATGFLQGVDGTVVLSNDAPAPSITFNLRTRDGDEGKHGKDY